MTAPNPTSESDARMRRTKLLSSVQRLLEQRRLSANAERRHFFAPDCSSPATYEACLPEYRHQLREMLGWPLTSDAAESGKPPEITYTLLRQDDSGRVYLAEVTVIDQVKGIGLLFLPPERPQGSDLKRLPLVIAQHGGRGTPEVAAGFTPAGDTGNYNDLIRGLRTKPEYQGQVAIFAPQLLVWDVGQEPQFDQNRMDREFRHLGGSRAAFDLLQLQRFLDALVLHPEVDAERIGMSGLSYGGFYTLFFAALEPRIRVAVSSCFVNDRYRYNWEDWVWKGSATRFLDAEVAGMICPRPLFLEAGAADELFAAEGFLNVAQEIGATYERLGIPERFHSRLHKGGHEYDPDGAAETFLMKWLRAH